MNAIVGVLVLAVTDLFFTWAYYQYRRPRPGRWTTWELPAQAICLGLVAGIGFGVALIGQSLFNMGAAPVDLFEVGLIVMTIAAAAASHVFLRSWLQRVAWVAEAVLVQTPVEPVSLASLRTNNSGPETPPQSHSFPGGRRRPRKKAA